MAAFDADVVYPFGEVKRGIPFDPEVEKRVEPFAAGVEVNKVAFKLAFPELRVPWTHARTLKTGTENHVVLIEALDMRGRQIRAAPVEVVERAPCLAVAVFGFLLFDIVLLECLAPTPSGLHESRLVAQRRPRRPRDDNRLEL